MKAAVDNGILDYLSEKHQIPKPPEIELTYSYMPMPPNRLIKTISLVPTIGAFYFALCPLITFVVFLTEIVREKEKYLRQGLSVVGMSHASFWISWAITGAIISAICVLSLIFMGYACQYEAFLQTNFVISFMVYFTFSFSMIIYAFFLSTFIRTVKAAYTISYAFVLFAVLLNLILSNSLLLYFIFFNKNGIQAGAIL